MLNIHIRTIPHESQRYNTVGDWVFSDEGKRLDIYVSALPNWRWEFLVALHELVEAVLCKDVAISDTDVDHFDLDYQGGGEPGDDPFCPYRRQHGIASGIERIVASLILYDWRAYEEALESLE